MKKIVIKYQPKCVHLLNYALECIIDFKDNYLNKTEIGIINGVLWIVKNQENKREFQIYIYHTKTQIVCDIR